MLNSLSQFRGFKVHGSTSLVCKPIWWACAAMAVAVGGFGTFTASEGSLATKVFAVAAKACERPWQQSKVVTRKHLLHHQILEIKVQSKIDPL